MLNTVWLQSQRNIEEGTALLLGGFDGLHKGHRLLLEKAKESGLPVGVMTIVGGKDGKGIFTFSERLEIFKRAGADFVFELPFEKIQPLSAEEFLKILIEEYHPKLFVCGEDFRFGMGAVGTPEILKRATQVCVEVLPLLEEKGEKISSKNIKKMLLDGDIKAANQALGEPYFLMGEVVKGRQVGRTMEFPTANVLFPNHKYTLKKGVYETRIALDGKTYKGITNYGARPTFENEEVLTETYIDGFCGNLYGKTLTVQFVRFLREIQKFSDIEALKQQLQTDLRRIREDD